MHMTCDLRVTRENRIVTNLAIMRNVHISHDPIVITNAGDALILRCTRMNSSELTNRIAITNNELGRLATVFHILGGATDGSEVCKNILFTNRGVTLDHSMRTYFATSADFDMRSNNRVRTNLNITSDFSLVINYSRCMNPSHYAPFVRTAQVILASAVSSPSTVACT